ncbi:MAG: hypothetical protein KJ579_04325, partial [Verrucomicrobia bacterium]|nr:hypothetical protein [Verrucomicrobiota bacterium]
MTCLLRMIHSFPTPATLAAIAILPAAAARAGHEFNGAYDGANLNRVAFPVGGMGAGMFCIEGYGALSTMSVRHGMEFAHEPDCFAAVWIAGTKQKESVARVIEGPIPDWKYFGMPGTGNGGAGRTYGLPRFRECAFEARFPFATVRLRDAAVPVAVEITGWSPFTPPDPNPSSLPAGMLEYRLVNTTTVAQRGVFSFNTQNFMGNGFVGPIDGGFVLYTIDPGHAAAGAFAIFTDAPGARIDHCWFRGGRGDALAIVWHNVAVGARIDNPPVPGPVPGASLTVPFDLGPGAETTIRLHTCWYVPGSVLKYGRRAGLAGAAFGSAPSHGTARGQQGVKGFLGRGLVNTFGPDGDSCTGTLTSAEFVLDRRHLHFMVGGGTFAGSACVNLLVDGRVVRSATGRKREHLTWTTFDLDELTGRTGRVQIVDRETGPWGHIEADHFVLSDEPIATLRTGPGNALVEAPARAKVLADFEGDDYGTWTADPPPGAPSACVGGECVPDDVPPAYVPWYATKFKSVAEVAAHWRSNVDGYRRRSAEWRDAFHASPGLPPEVCEAVAANLTILKSPTVLRQHDGRLWCWEGCGDSAGCCPGSCTHVWNYEQAICHLFPSLARGMRETAFGEGQDKNGRQAFRVNLPISPGGGKFNAADGHLGEIMKAHREWRISGDDAWMTRLWPRIRVAMEYAIRTWDPRETGLLEEEHHNTYDVNYFGPNGHCGSFYLGALAAAIRMGTTAGDDVARYRALLAKGRKRMETELFNGEYFVQIVKKEGLARNFTPTSPEDQSSYYRDVAQRVNDEGPKYQYGAGCLSDGVIGFWMARVCGIGEDLVDPAKVLSHLL